MSMPYKKSMIGAVAALALSGATFAQDWPQWRGQERDARVPAFETPKAWPKTLTAGWKVSVGNGVASPAMVGGKLFVFARQGNNEVLRCMDAQSGKELWKDEYEVAGADGPASGFAGPRSSPTVADGKVVTLGVRGHLSCVDAASGKLLWRKAEFDTWPRFYTSSSPIVVGGLCIAQLGSESAGAIVAYDLASGEQRWKWADGGTAYASPVTLKMGEATVVVAETPDKVVGLDAASGKLHWETPFAVRGRGYNAATPIVDDGRLILTGSGRGTRLVSIAKEGESFAVKESWSNEDNSVMYNTPVVLNGLIFGLSDSDQLFCVGLADGKTRWSVALTKPEAAPPAPPPPSSGGEEGGERGGRGRRGGGGGRGGYGSIVAAGDVLFALIPAGDLVVFKPVEAEFQELARYKVSDGGANAYPIVTGKHVYVKDQDALAVWTIGE